MRLVTFTVDGGPPTAGVLLADGGIVPIAGSGWDSVLDVVRADDLARLATHVNATSPAWPLDRVRLLPPLPDPPRNVFCVGVNYRSHFDEGNRPLGTAAPDAPVLFTKPWTSLVGTDQTVELDRTATQQADWEAEIAVVIGRGGRNISPADGLGHVFGYALANDLSARDLQLEHGPTGQWFKGKSLDGFCPLGPSLVTADEVGDHRTLRVQLRVNGELEQDFVASDMINDIGRIVARVSVGMALLPGDIILTGTAAGVGHWHRPPRYLAAGDVVEISCDRLGVLRTPIGERPSS